MARRENFVLGQLVEARGVSSWVLEQVVCDICVDSRGLEPGSVFFAIPGADLDGWEFVGDAFSAGAVAAVCSAERVSCRGDLAEFEERLIFVEDVRACLALAVKRFFADPSTQVRALGVTGTNGKTSTCWILSQALAALGRGVFYSGTLGFQEVLPGTSPRLLKKSLNTCSHALEIYSVLEEGLDSVWDDLIAEVSSHGLSQKRTAGLEWDAAVLTNLSRDHLDYHANYEDYLAAKAKLFVDELSASSKQDRFAVFPTAFPEFESLCQGMSRKLRRFRFGEQAKGADAWLGSSVCESWGTRLELKVFGESLSFQSQLIGDYNLANLLCSALVLRAYGYAAQEVERALAEVEPVPGRLERVPCEGLGVYVDYAHTPDALFRVHQSLRPLTEKRIITVFGCGGDRDRGKRPMMGQVVSQMADRAIVTSDNPRSENPEGIIEDILPGMKKGSREGFSYDVVLERADAIARALEVAEEGDLVLIAGKGHEDYQEINGQRHPFLDTEVVRRYLIKSQS